MNCTCGWVLERVPGSTCHNVFRCPLCGAISHELEPADTYCLSHSKRVASAQRLLLAVERSGVSRSHTSRQRRGAVVSALAMVLGVMICLGCLERGDLARLTVGSTAMLAVTLGALGLRIREHGPRRQFLPTAALIAAVMGAGLTCLPFEKWVHLPAPSRPLARLNNSGSVLELPPDAYSATLINAGEWTAAPSPAQRSTMQAYLLFAKVARVHAGDEFGADTTSSRLSLVLEFSNRSTTRVYRYYKDWSVLNLKLKDNFGNSYTLYRKPADQDVGGSTVPAAVYPGKGYKVQLVFEPPVPRARDLFLELPAECLGSSEAVRMRIPVRFITTEPDASEPGNTSVPELNKAPLKTRSRSHQEPGERIAVRTAG